MPTSHCHCFFSPLVQVQFYTSFTSFDSVNAKSEEKKKHFVLHSFVCARARKEIIDSFFSASKMYCCAKENEKEYRLC